MLLQRPKAGSQVPFCPIEKKMFDCWSHIDAGTFKVRGENYLRYDYKTWSLIHLFTVCPYILFFHVKLLKSVYGIFRNF